MQEARPSDSMSDSFDEDTSDDSSTEEEAEHTLKRAASRRTSAASLVTVEEGEGWPETKEEAEKHDQFGP